jgi:hypothetical protein
MPARESKQLRDMHQLLQQLEDLHSAHDLDHLGAPGNFWDPRTYTKAGKAQIAADVEMRNSFDEKWAKVEDKKDVLKKFVTSKLTTDNKTVIDAFLSKDKKANKDFEVHKAALKVVIDNADDAEIQRMVEALWKNSSTRILLNEWVKSEQYINK